MPRTSRIRAPRAVFHLISRFVDHRFEMDDAARRAYLARLGVCLPRTDWSLLGYGLMSTHVHLCGEAGRLPHRSWLHPLNTWWAGWVNERRRAMGQRSLGPVFADRAREIVVAPSRTARLLSYIHNNPVRAGVVRSADVSLWTSHRAITGSVPSPSFLDTTRALELSGFENSAEGRAQFDEFVLGRADRGDDDFAEFEVRDSAAIPMVSEGAFPSQATTDHDDPLRVVWDACAEADVPLEVVVGRSRQRQVVEIRAQALLRWSTSGRPLSQMASVLGISRAAASQLLIRRRGKFTS